LYTTKTQATVLDNKNNYNIAYGEIETAHPGLLGSQDNLYVGTMKGVGRIYQQTYIDVMLSDLKQQIRYR
jgi:hypothetical protein